uniref:Nuclear pore complex protein Nup153 n=1 Tax=Mucochytrium quahogii TaxID=96639 RepID=A0A7S2SQ45_9STRA|mmetsp:Transcript_1797/g.2715  ORF Transcript_1797/g.2715 Transcript_1797/m.2715 type:complete len:1407 (+) Transcript_1797:130-4350(+)
MFGYVKSFFKPGETASPRRGDVEAAVPVASPEVVKKAQVTDEYMRLVADITYKNKRISNMGLLELKSHLNELEMDVTGSRADLSVRLAKLSKHMMSFQNVGHLEDKSANGATPVSTAAAKTTTPRKVDPVQVLEKKFAGKLSKEDYEAIRERLKQKVVDANVESSSEDESEEEESSEEGEDSSEGSGEEEESEEEDAMDMTQTSPAQVSRKRGLETVVASAAKRPNLGQQSGFSGSPVMQPRANGAVYRNGPSFTTPMASNVWSQQTPVQRGGGSFRPSPLLVNGASSFGRRRSDDTSQKQQGAVAQRILQTLGKMSTPLETMRSRRPPTWVTPSVATASHNGQNGNRVGVLAYSETNELPIPSSSLDIRPKISSNAYTPSKSIASKSSQERIRFQPPQDQSPKSIASIPFPPGAMDFSGASQSISSSSLDVPMRSTPPARSPAWNKMDTNSPTPEQRARHSPTQKLNQRFIFTPPLGVPSCSSKSDLLAHAQHLTSNFVFGEKVQRPTPSYGETARPRKKQAIIQPSVAPVAKTPKDTVPPPAKQPEEVGQSSLFKKLLKKKAGKWKCASCLVTNDNKLDECPCCETPRPASSSTTTKSPEQTSTPISASHPFAKFALKNNQWKCPVCLVKNDMKSIECVSCENPKPAGEKEEKKVTFNLASSTPAHSESDAPKKKIAATPFNFGQADASTDSKTADTPFKFGTPGESKASPSPFNFGPSPAQDKAAEEKNAPSPVPFSFSTPSGGKKPEGDKPAETPFSFGAKATEPKKEESGFSFGASSTNENEEVTEPAKDLTKGLFGQGSKTVSSTPFSFGTSNNDKPSGQQDKNGSDEQEPPKRKRLGASSSNTETPTTGGFSFGASSKVDAPAPSLSFGASSKADTSVESKPGFSFGASSQTDAPAESKPGFSFGAPSKTDTPAESNSGFSFGASSNEASSTESKPAISFGGSSTSSPATSGNEPFAFGASSSTKESTAKQPFSFGASSSDSNNSSNNSSGFSFGASTGSSTSGGEEPSAKKRQFGGESGDKTVPGSTFGASPPAENESKPFAFGSNSSSKPFAFGADKKPSTTPQFGASSENAPQFGAKTTQNDSTPQFGAISAKNEAEKASGFSFGSQPTMSNSSSVAFGASSSGNTPSVNGGAQFGGATKTDDNKTAASQPFSFGASSSATTPFAGSSDKTSFPGTTPSSTGSGFHFGASSSTPSFGASSSTNENSNSNQGSSSSGGGFQFGASSNTASSTPFGQAPASGTPATGMFGASSGNNNSAASSGGGMFGGNQQPPQQQNFNFGGGSTQANTQAAPANPFGGGAAAPSPFGGNNNAAAPFGGNQSAAPFGSSQPFQASGTGGTFGQASSNAPAPFGGATQSTGSFGGGSSSFNSGGGGGFSMGVKSQGRKVVRAKRSARR